MALLVAAVAGSIVIGPRSALPANGPRRVSWAQAQQLLQRCRVERVMQAHSRLVTLKLRGGDAVVAREPRIDDVFQVLNRLPRSCRPRSVATE